LVIVDCWFVISVGCKNKRHITFNA
jgi:hypothetical protein